ncbi:MULTISPECIES: helix-turn-helix transcriptional regulator [unclassified Streptomyces]|uniref:helix-turn-helix domain-containing protein n=1 Tax=unclassified Streptomyces TaxID=2593676 RepID=UPI00088762B4|nr:MULTISPECIES: helix-turn-helix transcriptional regulator [unclassified Streptomyces]PBC82045.1 helix-turn-helix protein [Streptomyces sp. 2321.6]SDR51768.1 Helix-turn-helix domain-containing protein [Streptomyces sp. KS_16]SEC41287.1 Helix-turn-helix domain-containing protein [Streptomyces sp. 2133.1]SEF02492.1 Helix-turn-helix domain-containing protein [Streptomyces sp. 2112.3]SNC67276.1 Helix-turn-helix domain-containing protein [Streptomyces sp. 2114.4]
MAGKAGTSEPETTDSLRAFGAVVKAFRKRAKLTQEGLARRVGFSAGTIASIEQGRRLPPPEFIERAERVLDSFGVLRAMAAQLARQPGLAAWFRQWARLEEQAISLYTYECRLMPGLLQTEAYARELFEHRIPLLTDEETETKVTARLDRQKLLRDRPNTAFSFIVDEHVFLRRTGGPDVARELLDHVLETVQRLRNVELQVMPLARGVHAGMDGPLQLLETSNNRWYAYCEGQRSGQLIPDSKSISTLHMRYAKLRSQALTPEDSRSLLTQMRGAL